MEKYQKIKLVGRGAYGMVYLCEHISEKKLVIIKEIPVDQMTGDERQASLNEAKVLSMFEHPNIIAYYENFLAEKLMVIVMEFAEGGTLYDYLQQRNGKLLSEQEVLYFFAQMVLALQHIHSRSILHRDLKSQNILLNGNKSIVKVGDFGISKILSTKSKAYTVVGTPCYISPELCEGKPYNQKSDIWALGCILYELLTLKRPFDASNLPALVMKIMRGNFDPVPEMYSNDMRQLLMSMLHLDPSRRPSTAQIMAQPFLINTLFGLYVGIGSLPSTSRPRKMSSRSSLLQVNSPVNKALSSETESHSSMKSEESPTKNVSESSCHVWFAERNRKKLISLPLRSETCVIKTVSLSATQKVGITEGGSIILWQSPGKPEKDNKESELIFFIPTVIEEKFPMSIISVSCSDDFTVCLSDNGVVLTFGKGSSGCLAHGNNDDVTQPKIVEALFGYSIVSVASGSKHILAVSEDNDVFAWGCGKSGCLGLGTAESHFLPQKVPIASGHKPVRVFCGVDSSFIVTTSGSLLACGSNRHNKLAMDTEDGHHLDEIRVFTPVHSDPLPQSKVHTVATGMSHTAVLTKNGELYTTGSNRFGQLGWGTVGMTHNMPGKVNDLESHTVQQVSCGDHFTLVSTSDQSVFVWGMSPWSSVENPVTSVHKVKSIPDEESITCVACHSQSCLIVTKKNKN